MKEFFDFSDKEFREYFLRNLPINFLIYIKIPNFLKENFNNNDLIRFYFKCFNKACVNIPNLLFDYKMKKISNDRLNKFLEIIKNETGVIISNRMTYRNLAYDYYVNSDNFNKLVDIFLDQI